MASPKGSGSIPLAPKRSLFKKSAPVEPVEEDEGLQLFSRSKEIFPDIIAENERRWKKLEKVEKNRLNGTVDQTDRNAPDGKRRRISQESDDGGAHSSDDEITTRLLLGCRASTAIAPQSPGAKSAPASTSPKQKRSPGSKSINRQESIDQKPSRKSKTQQPEVITLNDSEDEAIEGDLKTPKSQNIDLNFDSDVEEEILNPVNNTTSPVKEVFEVEEFPEYVAKAREGATRRVFGRLDPAQSNARSDSVSNNSSNPKPEMTSSVNQGSTPRLVPDPVVQILVSSPIEGTKPLVIKRKLSQRLKDVKYAWCDKQVLNGQPVSEETKSLIFLTWRGSKVFDVTTCKALGLSADASGRLRIGGEGFDDEGRIHLEAWTSEIFDEFKKQKAAERKRLVLDPMEEEEEDEEDQLHAERKDVEQQIQKFKIILKSKDRPEFKIQVVSSTAISKMINAFRHNYKIPENVKIALYLDGDKLGPGTVVGEADLDELTTIDVHIG